MRLIDADALKERKFVGVENWTPTEATSWQRGWNDAIDTIVEVAPTIEADIKCEDCKTITALKAALEPVKRGKWIKISDRNYKCSACGDWWSGEEEEIKSLKYCPNCGARMPEGSEE